MRPLFRGLTVLILVAFPLAANATQGNRQLQKILASTERLWAKYDACESQVEITEEFQRLERAFILKRNDPRSVEMMAIARHASDQEKVDLLQYKNNITQCYQHLFTSFTDINPRFTVLLVRFINEDDQLVLQTVQDDVTVGARNQIVQLRFVERLRDWSFTGERIYLQTWHLRRPCSIYCSSYNAAALQQTSTEGLSNVVGTTPTNGQTAKVQHFWNTTEPPPPAAPKPEIVAKPPAQAAETTAAPAEPEPQTTAESPPRVAKIAVPPAAPKPEIAAKSPVQAAKTTTAPAEPEAQTTAESPPRDAEIAVVPAAPEPEVAAKPPVQAAETDCPPTTPETQNTAASPPPQEAVTATAPAAPMAGSSPEAPAQDVATGLKPAAGPTDEPAEPQKQRVVIAAATQTAEPRYTVHLASMRTEMEARAEWGQLQARYPHVLGDRVLFTREVRINGKGTFIRVLTGLFHNHDRAIDLCSQFSGDDQFCAVLKLEASTWIVP